ncbi:Putative transposase of IS4/5 family [Rhizobiales bacterium GAS191]|nr:Putative transposase of IS4/5 family [Rhizobiales bacterium GAS191]
MAWTKTTRAHYQREALRYASDLTDAEWRLIEPFLPRASKIGRPRKTNLRSVVEGLSSQPDIVKHVSSRVMQTFPRGRHNAVIQRWLPGCQTHRRVDDLQTSD